MEIVVTEDVLDPELLRKNQENTENGACVQFIGMVRNKTAKKNVVRLEFEAYVPMAIKELRKIATNCLEKWPIEKISIFHRIGILDLGEIPVVITVSSAHRKEAFEACSFAIDELKKSVPIWKKEVFEDGEVWVAAHP